MPSAAAARPSALRAPATPVVGAAPPEASNALLTMTAILQRLESRDAGGDPALPETVEELSELGLSASSGKLGATQIERLRMSREKRPELTVAAHEKELMRDLSVLPGESWSYRRHAEQLVMPQAAGYHGLRKTIAILAEALDLHRVKGADHSRAFLSQAYKAAQCAALHPQKQWGYGWPLLGIADPDGQARPGYTPAESSALAAWHRDSELWKQSLQGGAKGGGKSGSSGGVDTTPGGGGGSDSKALKAEVEKLKQELAAERKKNKGGGGGKKGDGPKGSTPERIRHGPVGHFGWG